MVVGSRAPHKATAQTLKLLNYYAAEKQTQMKVTVTGLSSSSDLGDNLSFSMLNVDFAGKVSDKRFDEIMGSCRALVYLSEIEGFGLPILEAYSFNTPVCYRNTSSPAELLKGLPGGWDGKTQDGFESALSCVLALTVREVAEIQAILSRQYDREKIVDRLLAVYMGRS